MRAYSASAVCRSSVYSHRPGISGPDASRTPLLLSRMETPMLVKVMTAFMPVTKAETEMSRTVDVGIYSASSSTISTLFWIWSWILPIPIACIEEPPIPFIDHGKIALSKIKSDL